MARIAGVDLPKEKRIEIGLSYLYGIGRPLAICILKETGIEPGVRVKNLTEAQISALNTFISQNCTVEGDLKREIQTNIRRYIDIGTYRGSRHKRGLPCRGQRTKTNARTKRGRRKTVGAVKAEPQTMAKEAPVAAKRAVTAAAPAAKPAAK